VEWGLAHRQLGALRAIGVDEIAYGKGHDYLTLVYQIVKLGVKSFIITLIIAAMPQRVRGQVFHYHINHRCDAS
jgi:hypothetical protein